MLFILAACEPPGPPVTPTPAVDKSFTTTVSGTVTVTEKGVSTALQGVNVSALVDKKVVKTVQTDAGGKYSLAVTHKGSFTLRISADKYVVQSLTIKTEKGTFKQDIALEKVLASTTVSGKVTAPDGTALGGVSVSVKDRPEISPVTTADDGTYGGLEVSHSGSFTLTAAKNGYAEKTAALTTRNTSAVQNFTLTLVGTLAFESPQIRKSKMLVITNPNADGTYSDQTYTNTLLYNGKAVTSGAVYSITKPTGITNEIGFDTATGEVSFGRALYDKITPGDITQPTGPPQTVTVQADYQGKTASYTFTVTDHFSPRDQHSSVVLGDDIYVIGGRRRNFIFSSGTGTPAIQSNEIWRSGDGGLTWDQVAGGTRFADRRSQGAVVLGDDIYVIAGVGGTSGTDQQNDVWKSGSRGESWESIAAAVSFPMDNVFASAVLNNTILLMGGLRRSAPFDSINEVWESSSGASWSRVTTSGTIFSKRQSMSSVVLGSGTAADPYEVYLMGGVQLGGSNFDEVWKSRDGVSWTHVNRTRPSPAPALTRFPARSDHSSAAVKSASGDTVYVIGGTQGSNLRSDVWKSVDRGVNWTEAAANAEFGQRAGHSSVVQGGSVYLIGGNSGGVFHNDVWRSTDGGASWVNVHKN